MNISLIAPKYCRGRTNTEVIKTINIYLTNMSFFLILLPSTAKKKFHILILNYWQKLKEPEMLARRLIMYIWIKQQGRKMASNLQRRHLCAILISRPSKYFSVMLNDPSTSPPTHHEGQILFQYLLLACPALNATNCSFLSRIIFIRNDWTLTKRLM